MIGEYSDDDFIKKLTVKEQRKYLMLLAEGMTDKQAWELLMDANKARATVIHNVNAP